MQRDDGFAPLFPIEAHAKGLLAVEHGPVAPKRHATLFQYLGQHLVTAALLLNVYTKEVGAGKVFVLAEHAAKRHDLIQGSARQDEAAAAVREDGLLLGPDRRSKVVGCFGVEVGQEAIQVVIVDISVQFDEDVPMRLGPHVRRPLHHGQELVLVQPPAVVRLGRGGVGGLDAVVYVEVGVVELVLGAQVGEGVGDVEAVVVVLAVREDEHVLLAPSQAVQVGRQLGRCFSRANLQHDGDVVHDAGGEWRAFLAKADLWHRAGSSRRGAFGEHVIAALAPEHAGDQGREEEEAEHYGGAQQAQRRQSHHHGGADALPEDMMFGEGGSDARNWR